MSEMSEKANICLLPGYFALEFGFYFPWDPEKRSQVPKSCLLRLNSNGEEVDKYLSVVGGFRNFPFC